MFQAMGDRMNNSAKSMLKSAGRKLGFKFDEISHKCLIPFGILSCCVTVAVGSVAFSHFEGWSYLNSVYYCVMTLSTIGFGDYVALQADGALQQRPQYVAFSFIYILIGLTVIGAFLNLVILRLIVTLPMTPDGSTNGDQAVDFSSNSESGFQHHEFRRKVRKRRKKRSHQNIANTSSRSKWDKLFSFAKSRSVEETEEQSSIVPQDASSSDDDLVRQKFRRTTLPSAVRNRECPQCKCRDFDSFDRHRSFDELIHRIKFQDWAENTIEKDREENTLKHF
uniref:Potassium channel domain-containing protein n=1 Tax=Ciona savignyi TaxID=51511 RepID=H2YJM0_CIOSA